MKAQELIFDNNAHTDDPPQMHPIYSALAQFQLCPSMWESQWLTRENPVCFVLLES
ncbi:hypothetical protein PHLCEN_2v2721 [Hermanssonia centrifuga]|uniref:Uncharacterized protein n=1 Tax=Hermanssonia centrifuga TaxID=98765 RepID=A0A2R6RHS9_9APHY|nr:hypothetical protein PHLCEN_2v2721 [Hermanssonia centrifuga]